MRKIKRKKQYIYCILILVLCGCLPVICQTVVWGELSKEVILLCSFKSGEDEVIHWHEANNQKANLHSYYHKKDQLEYQDPAYRGRTSLFLSEISKGNASLLIKNVQESDEKTYSCYVGTKLDKVECTVKLSIAAFENPSIQYTSKDGKKQFNCSVKTYIPENALRITWLQNDTIVGTGSDFYIQKNTDALQCVIHHTYLNRNWTGSWEMTERSSDGDKVKFECKLCQTIQQYFTVHWTMRTNSSETEVASMDSRIKTLQPNHNYKHRLEPDSGEYGFNIKDLSKNDTGEYLCTTVEENRMHIKVTSLTILHVEERKLWIRIVIYIVVIIIFAGIVCFICWKCKKRHSENNGQGAIALT